MINIKSIKYAVELITESGNIYDLTPALIKMDWEESINEMAQRATIVLQQKKAGGAWLHGLAKINCIIRIKGKWNNAARPDDKQAGMLLFEGTIWDWSYASGINKELTLTAYDNLMRLNRSKDFFYYTAGMNTQTLIADICDEWGIPLSYEWEHGITHQKKAFRGKKTIADMIIGLLDEASEKTGEKYVLYYKGNQLAIKGYGTNRPVYLLDQSGTVSTNNKLTINNLVTKVKVFGRQDDAGRSQVEAIVEGDLSFGVLQEIVLRDNNKTLAEAKAEANVILGNRGSPEEMIKWDGPDLPFLRKGDKVEIKAGNLLGFFYIEGIMHFGDTRRMTLTLTRGQTWQAKA